jgi:hypothetical protein
VSAVPLVDLAKTIRSKNAGVDLITFDIIFAERATYERVKRARVLTRESVMALYGIAAERIADFVEFDPGNAIKFTIYRLRPSGDISRTSEAVLSRRCLGSEQIAVRDGHESYG